MGLTSKLINRDGLDPDTVVTQDGETGVHVSIRRQKWVTKLLKRRLAFGFRARKKIRTMCVRESSAC